MKTFAWCTDVHLDFIDGANETGRVHEEFAAPLSKVDCDGYFITGDISNGANLVRHLRIIDAHVTKPVYFVCGNHDFYGSDFESMRMQLRGLAADSKNLRYLSTADYVSLSKKTGLVGHDGWYDAMLGDPLAGRFVMRDWSDIGDFRNAGAMIRDVGMYGAVTTPQFGIVMAIARKAAFEAAEHVRATATKAARRHQVVVVLTHVPPWPQVHIHNGKSGSPAAMPWYTSKLMGDAIQEVAAAHPDTRFEVFCGHTHGKADARISHNLVCHVGGAEYLAPGIAGTVRLP